MGKGSGWLLEACTKPVEAKPSNHDNGHVSVLSNSTIISCIHGTGIISDVLSHNIDTTSPHSEFRSKLSRESSPNMISSLHPMSSDTDQPDNIKNKHLHILYYNARSLLPMSEELCTIVEAENPVLSALRKHGCQMR